MATLREDNTLITMDRYIYETMGVPLPSWRDFVDMALPMSVTAAIHFGLISLDNSCIGETKRNIIFLQWQHGTEVGKQNLEIGRKRMNELRNEAQRRATENSKTICL